MHYNCLIVDDEAALSESTCEYFNMFDVATFWVSNEKACMDFLKKNTADLILLDINLGRSSGFELCKKIRIDWDIPILFISARTSDDDVLLALGIGGDDYIPKPYSLSVLLAKVRAVLKRCSGSGDSSLAKSQINFGSYTLDFNTDQLWRGSEKVKLKAMEYKLLSYLAKNKNRTVSKEELFSNVWEDRFTGDSTLNVHIRRLREKIEENPNQPQYIKTIWGTGYVFDAE